MAEFVEVMRQGRRLCEAYGDCEKCILDPSLSDCYILTSFGNADMKKAEETVMDWAKKHPEPVYPSWVGLSEKLFPNHPDFIKPCMFMPRVDDCTSITCPECEQRPIPADIAEKLGIKPISEVSTPEDH